MASVPFQIGPTPNPNSIRVGLSQPMFPKALTFKSAGEAEGNALATGLLGIAGVVQVFMLNNFISINKDPAADWGKIEPKVAEILMKNLNG
jgi:scaffold Nfu/NifU family protein